MNDVCGEIQELMIPYLNHITTKDETGRLVTHLAECGVCRKEMTENIKLHSKIKITFSQIPPDIKIRAYDKIDFPKKEQSIMELIADDIIIAANAPALELYSKLIYTLINSPIKRAVNYTFSRIDTITKEI
ncbi:MAG: zf-HC2 domain-containing protein [Oscillospiraceae bacterium]|nr:zf-HC2 domain-containing protein [Oscillospiraceae bacterium]